MRRALVSAGWLILCGFLPLVALYYAIGPVAFGTAEAVDFHFAYYGAAKAIRAGEDVYPTAAFVVHAEEDLVEEYVYPPLIAVATIPWTLLPVALAESLFQLFLVAAFVATLAVLGVRDWRCYGLAFLWPPVTDAVFNGNVSILLGLAAALAWRYRDRPLAAGASVGTAIAAKAILWPLAIWLAAIRRTSAALWSVGLAGAVLLVSWSVIGFRGIDEYPALARRLSDLMDERGYTLYAAGIDIGLPEVGARTLWITLAVTTLASMIVLARRGDERRAFVLALAATIAFSPIVWLHYFTLLLVVVAVTQPRLGLLWFMGLPMQLVVGTALYNGSPFQTAAVLVVAGMTVGLALRPASDKGPQLALSSPAAARP